MTQKELLYVEDAIKHENNIIMIINESLDLLEDEDLVDYMEGEVKKHNSMVQKLCKLLGGLANE